MEKTILSWRLLPRTRAVPACGIALVGMFSMLWLGSYAEDGDSAHRPSTCNALSQFNGLAANMDGQPQENVLAQYDGLAARMDSAAIAHGIQTPGNVAEYHVVFPRGYCGYGDGGFRPDGIMFHDVSPEMLRVAELAQRACMYFQRERAALAREALSEWEVRKTSQEDWNRMAEVEREKYSWTTGRQEETAQRDGLEWVNPTGMRAPHYEGIGTGDPSLARDKYTGELYRIHADGTKVRQD